MTKAERDKVLRRDFGTCYHCGQSDDRVSVHHRINRGAGGKNAKADSLSNLMAMCSEFNGLMESDSASATRARAMGWKLSQYQAPDFEPVYDMSSDSWFILENDGTRHLALVDL
jgi:hypothetical protein